jgi:Flp pilus assembly protein TadB
MTTIWRILGGAVAFGTIYLVRHAFGTAAAALVLVLLLFAWWLLHLYYVKRLDALCTQFEQLNADQKGQALRELDPEIRKDIEKRIAKKRQG